MTQPTPTVPGAASASELRFETLFEQAPFSVQLLSVQGRTLKVNQAWRDLWGTQDGDPLLEWVLSDYDILADPQLEAKGLTPYLRRAFAGEAVRVPAAYYDPAELGKAGRARWVEATARPIKAADGSVVEVMLIHEDVTERVLAERQLRASEQRLKQLANTIPQLAWIADAQGAVGWYNDRWYAYTGTTPQEMQGWGWQSVPDPAVLPEVMEQWRHSLASGEPFQMTVPLRGRDGKYRPFFTLVAPLKDEGGRVVQWFGTNTDVSPLHEAEQVRRDGERRKDEFLAMLAHELRNPLAPISMAAQLFRHAGTGERAIRAAEVIERQVRHMTKLVDDLLDVSRVTRGLITLHMERVELHSVVAGALEQMQPLLQASGRSLAPPAGLAGIAVRGDRIRLVQVTVNLLNNAIKYSPAGTPIELAAQVVDDRASISVRDQGIGIDAAFQPHVFDLFTQAQRTADRSQGGLGIGLALVRSLVHLHGGEVRLESPGLGGGSCFTVTLPLAPDALPPPVDGPAPPENAPRRPLAILVVDDNVDAAQTLAALLEAQGHTVRTASDAAGALEIARGFRADACILDIGLPGVDGYELVRQLRAQGTTGTFIALTGYGQDRDRAQSRQAGFHHHLVKPVDAEVLQDALSGAS
ncbi:MAG TPA: ATP-binding protein [Ramlibacter sp.]